MSIRARIEDADVLRNQGRKEGAWILALVAAAATSRKRYPRPTGDGEAFKSFIRDISGTIVAPGRGVPAVNIVFDQTPLEDLLYKQLPRAVSCSIGLVRSRVMESVCSTLTPMTNESNEFFTVASKWAACWSSRPD